MCIFGLLDALQANVNCNNRYDIISPHPDAIAQREREREEFVG